jgi:hypothetical protein
MVTLLFLSHEKNTFNTWLSNFGLSTVEMVTSCIGACGALELQKTDNYSMTNGKLKRSPDDADGTPQCHIKLKI